MLPKMSFANTKSDFISIASARPNFKKAFHPNGDKKSHTGTQILNQSRNKSLVFCGFPRQIFLSGLAGVEEVGAILKTLTNNRF